MKLTKKKAIQLSIELWEWLAETGLDKEDWPEFSGGDDDESFTYKGRYIDNGCFLCEKYQYADLTFDCSKCPLSVGKTYGCYETAYQSWERVRTKIARKKYAKLFLEQLRSL